MSLSALLILPAIGVIVLVGFVGIALQRMVDRRQRMRTEYRRRAEVKQFAATVKGELLPKLRPLGMRRIHLEPYRDPTKILHRRRLKLHADLRHGQPPSLPQDEPNRKI